MCGNRRWAGCKNQDGLRGEYLATGSIFIHGFLENMGHIVLFRRFKYIVIYVALIIVFSLFYVFLPEASFRQSNPDANLLDWVYFSVVTITTLGYGDITPLSWVAKVLVMAESLLGILMLGLFLNREAQYAIEKRDKESMRTSLMHSFRMLEYMEQYFCAAEDRSWEKDTPVTQRFERIYQKLRYQPKEFEFNEHILNNIYWSAGYVVSDFQRISIGAQVLSDGGFLNISAIIHSLDGIAKSNVDGYGEPSKGETMQHRASIAFENAFLLSKIVH